MPMLTDPWMRGRVHPATYGACKISMAFLMIHQLRRTTSYADDILTLQDLLGRDIVDMFLGNTDALFMERLLWDDFLDALEELPQQQQPKWLLPAYCVAMHHQSRSLGVIILPDGPVLHLDDARLADGDFFEMINFRKPDFYRCVDLHIKLPDVFVSPDRHKCNKAMGLFIMVRRWVGGLWKHVERELCIRRNILSDLFHTIVQVYVNTDYKLLATNVDVVRLMPQPGPDILDTFVDDVSLSGSVLEGVVGFADGKAEACCKPSTSAGKKRGYTFQDDIQRLFYNRHYKGHGLKIAHHIWADGLVQVVIGSINTGDQNLMDLSNLESILEIFNDARESHGKIRIKFYTDPAYTTTRNVIAKKKGALTAAESAMNSNMIRSRSVAEDTFKNFVDLFKQFDNRKAWRILTHARSTFADSLTMSTIWYNLHTCLYGNQANALFASHAPCVEVYMENVNMIPCKIPAVAELL